MMRSRPPFRADHVGSILRTAPLKDAREKHFAGKLSAAELKAVEDVEIRKIIAKQEEIGLEAITDGEFRRSWWHMDFLGELDGVDIIEADQGIQFTGGQTKARAPRVTGKLGSKAHPHIEHFKFLKANTSKTPKQSIPSPSMLHYRGGRSAIDPKVYPEMEGFWADLAAVYADEIEALGKRGCTYLQLDDTSLAYLNDPTQREYVTKIGGDGESQHLTYIKLINASLTKKPAGMTVCTHMCRGNFRSSWAASGGYDHVADALFNQLNVDGFFLEYDDARSGSFEPLRFVPKGKIVVLGLVTTKRAALEKKDELKRRIEEASKYVPLDQICLSPQCGFSSTVEGNALTIDEEIAKLNLVVEVAREVWG